MKNYWKWIAFVSLVLWEVQGNDNIDELVEWLRSSEGGFINDKISIRRSNPNDSSSPFGIFANDNLKKNELIFSIPPSNLFTAGRTYSLEKGAECGVVFKLIDEMKNPNNSEFRPYVNYLKEQRYGQLPSDWSRAGKELLLELLGHSSEDPLPPAWPVSWVDDWVNECGGSTDPFDVNAYLMVKQRGWDEVLVPVYDMMSHRNGNWLNTVDDSIHDAIESGRNVIVTASRDIAKGEELHTSYNFCTNCSGRNDSYGTFEIVRDYGFVEMFPQRWWFLEDFGFELNKDESGNLVVTWLTEEPGSEMINYLEDHLARIKKFEQVELEPLRHSFAVEEEIPENEMDVIIDLYESIVTAITHGLNDLMNEQCDNGTCKTKYDLLNEKQDKLQYNVAICDTSKIQDFNDYSDTDSIQSHYQLASFFTNEESNDTCFDLDDVYQICSSYRPHYHEMVVHHTARYLKEVKRVLWVGGGDSMLLHEILKYPVELVVGLEIDQKVTRYAFKHFGTQPHWDDPRVQWWYGDASKSLLMLPKEYFGSFDMVLVDLSESVTSITVTEELDVFDALSLLLKPEGILVKNEIYIEKISKTFKYAVQVHFKDCPVLCSQVLALGSNTLDFSQATLNEHNIDNLFIKPLSNSEHRYDIWEDYRNSPSTCKDFTQKKSSQQSQSPGIIMILEVEVSLELEIKTVIQNALKIWSLEIISFQESNEEHPVAFVVLQQGYILARVWPENNYVAIDLHFWSSFQLLEDVKNSLLETLNSSKHSAFRIVAGGIRGLPTWKVDDMNRGPPQIQCHDSQENLKEVTTEDLKVFFSKSMDLVKETHQVMAAVICSSEKLCDNYEILKNNPKFSQVLSLTCPYLNSDPNSMQVCEETLESILENKKFRVIVLDPNAPIEMAQIILKLLSKKRNFGKKVFIMAVMLDSSETWRRNWLERFRHDIFKYEPLFRAKVSLNEIEYGVTSFGDDSFVEHLLQLLKEIQQITSLQIQVKRIYGGVPRYLKNFKPTQFFEHSDYDQTEPLAQWQSQQPVAHQTVLQLETQFEKFITTDHLRQALEGTLKNFSFQASSKLIELGQGCLMVSLFKEGTVVVTWDGAKHIDLNVFLYEINPKPFCNFFKLHFPTFDTVLLDEQPRGYGRVVNFKSDLTQPRLDPHWAS